MSVWRFHTIFQASDLWVKFSNRVSSKSSKKCKNGFGLLTLERQGEDALCKVSDAEAPLCLEGQIGGTDIKIAQRGMSCGKELLHEEGQRGKPHSVFHGESLTKGQTEERNWGCRRTPIRCVSYPTGKLDTKNWCFDRPCFILHQKISPRELKVKHPQVVVGAFRLARHSSLIRTSNSWGESCLCKALSLSLSVLWLLSQSIILIILEVAADNVKPEKQVAIARCPPGPSWMAGEK